MTGTNRVIAVVDGFNYYKRLIDYQDTYNECVKWLNYRCMIDGWLDENDDMTSLQIHYFTAIPYYRRSESVRRQKNYLNVLKSVGVNVIYGSFKQRVFNRCPFCEYIGQFSTEVRYISKDTDIKLAATLMEYALTDKFDKCFLLTANSDLVYVITKIKEHCPEKKIVICPPPPATKSSKKKYFIEELLEASQSKAIYTSWNKIKKCQFPDDYHGFVNPCERDKLCASGQKVPEEAKVASLYYPHQG